MTNFSTLEHYGPTLDNSGCFYVAESQQKVNIREAGPRIPYRSDSLLSCPRVGVCVGLRVAFIILSCRSLIEPSIICLFPFSQYHGHTSQGYSRASRSHTLPRGLLREGDDARRRRRDVSRRHGDVDDTGARGAVLQFGDRLDRTVVLRPISELGSGALAGGPREQMQVLAGVHHCPLHHSQDLRTRSSGCRVAGADLPRHIR